MIPLPWYIEIIQNNLDNMTSRIAAGALKISFLLFLRFCSRFFLQFHRTSAGFHPDPYQHVLRHLRMGSAPLLRRERWMPHFK